MVAPDGESAARKALRLHDFLPAVLNAWTAVNQAGLVEDECGNHPWQAG